MIGKFRFQTRAAVAGLFFPIALLAACGGKGVTIGSNAGELRAVDPAAVTGTVPACAPLQAHPNVCCKGGPNEASECVAFVNSPFHKCDDGWTLYPDPASCCDLSDPAKCVVPPPGPPPPTGCGYACAPGWWPVVNDPGECCHILPNGNSLECSKVQWGWAEPAIAVCGGGGVVDAGPPTQIDGGPGVVDGGAPPPVDGGPGVVDAGPPIDGGPAPTPEPGPVPNPVPPPIACDGGAPPPMPPPPPWPGPVCSAPCPNGFHPRPADPSICCAPEGNGGEICFSQAVGQAGGPAGVSFGGRGGSGTTGSGGSSPPSPGK